MAGAEAIFPKPLLDFGGEPEQPEHVGDGRAVLSDPAGDLFLGHSELDNKLVIGLRFFNRVQVFALQIFDEGDLQGRMFVRFADDGGNPDQAGALRGTPAAFAGNQLEESVVERTNDDRLNDAVLPDLAQREVSLRRGNRDRDPLHGVVRVTADVPSRLERLHVARRVGGAADELVVARIGRLPAM